MKANEQTEGPYIEERAPSPRNSKSMCRESGEDSRYLPSPCSCNHGRHPQMFCQRTVVEKALYSDKCSIAHDKIAEKVMKVKPV